MKFKSIKKDRALFSSVKICSICVICVHFYSVGTKNNKKDEKNGKSVCKELTNAAKIYGVRGQKRQCKKRLYSTSFHCLILTDKLCQCMYRNYQFDGRF